MPHPGLPLGPLQLRFDGAALLVDDGEGSVALPPSILAALAARYGRAPADDLPSPQGWLAVGDAMRLGTLSYRSPVDVIANDYVLVETGPGQGGARIVPMPLVVAALRALAGRTSATGT